MKIFSWNVNGVRAIEKKGFLEWIDDENPDIVCIQETKAKVEQLGSSLIKDHGYYTYWHSGGSYLHIFFVNWNDRALNFIC